MCLICHEGNYWHDEYRSKWRHISYYSHFHLANDIEVVTRLPTQKRFSWFMNTLCVRANTTHTHSWIYIALVAFNTWHIIQCISFHYARTRFFPMHKIWSYPSSSWLWFWISNEYHWNLYSATHLSITAKPRQG